MSYSGMDMLCDYELCRYNFAGLCTQAESRLHCVSVARAVLCLDKKRAHEDRPENDTDPELE